MGRRPSGCGLNAYFMVSMVPRTGGGAPPPPPLTPLVRLVIVTPSNCDFTSSKRLRSQRGTVAVLRLALAVSLLAILSYSVTLMLLYSNPAITILQASSNEEVREEKKGKGVDIISIQSSKTGRRRRGDEGVRRGFAQRHCAVSCLVVLCGTLCSTVLPRVVPFRAVLCRDVL